MESEQLFTTGEILTGITGRRAAASLRAIEQRTAYIMAQSHYLLEIFLTREANDAQQTRGANLFQKWQYTQKERAPRIEDLERYAPHWKDLVGSSASTRAVIANALAKKYQFSAALIPNIQDALGLDVLEVADTYQRLYKQPIQSIYSAVAPAPRATMEFENVFTAAMIRAVEKQIEWVNLERGAILYQAGDPSDALHVVIHGRLRAEFKDTQGEPVTRQIARGDTIGETALISDSVRTATVRAVRDSLLMRMPRTVFDTLSEQYPRPMIQFFQALAARARTAGTGKDGAPRIAAVALLPISPAFPVAAFIDKLKTALVPYGSTLHLNPARLSDLLSPDALTMIENAADQGAVVAWLNEQEAAYRFVLYEMDATLTPWTERCLRQADKVLLIGANDQNAGLSALEKQLAGRRDLNDQTDPWRTLPHELVLLRATDGLITGTARWLEGRTITHTHHLGADSQGDYQRLARRLAGRAFGLVLGGGGARCFAHIGVIKALREANIPIDQIGGTSGGAIAAASFAMGADAATMKDQTRLLFNSFTDFTFPLLSVMSGRRFTAALQKLFGETMIEDLPIPYFCLSSNLTRAKRMIHQRGLLWRATRASASLPGVFPPVLEDGDLLIDGAIFDNVPILPMIDLCDGGTVIAVDVEDATIRKRDYRFSDTQSGWALLGSRVLPWMKGRYKAPSMVGLMSRATILSSIDTRNTTRNKADLYLNPPVGKFGTFEVKACDAMIEIGYRYALEQIAGWTRA